MDIRYAILGLLSWHSYSGYDLKRIISDSDLLYWSGNNNQIYNNLIDLHKEGLVSQEIQQQEALPAKKIYSITFNGREALRQWSLAEPHLPEGQHPFLIQLLWTGSLGQLEREQLLSTYEEELRVRILMRSKTLETQQYLPPEHHKLECFLWQQIGSHLLDNDENELKWIQRLRMQLNSHDKAAGESEKPQV